MPLAGPEGPRVSAEAVATLLWDGQALLPNLRHRASQHSRTKREAQRLQIQPDRGPVAQLYSIKYVTDDSSESKAEGPHPHSRLLRPDWSN